MLLDTCAAIAIMEGPDKTDAVLTAGQRLVLPIVALGELYLGALGSTSLVEEFRKVEDIARASKLMSCDRGTALHYSKIKSDLRKKGKPIPENDLWIAALAVQHDMPILTNDAHFSHVDGLRIVTW